MALKLNERYPGRFNNPTENYPQGSFKNRTTPSAKDGSYLEQDWANDKEGFFQSLMESAGFAANGQVDRVGSSQYFDAMKAIVLSSMISRVGSSGERMYIPAASASGSFSADEVVVKSQTTGYPYILNNVSKTINLAIVGVGGFDSGVAPSSGFVSIYLIYNPTSDVSGLLACSSSTSDGPTYTGSNMPSGFTASCLVSSWGTNTSRLLVSGLQVGRLVSISNFESINTTVQQPIFQPLNLTTVPPNAKSVLGWSGVTSSSTGLSKIIVASNTGGLGWSQNTTSGSLNSDSSFKELAILNPRTIYYSVTVASGTLVSATISVTAYKF